MKFLSFNYRGMASASERLALRRLFESEHVDIIMLQETLGTIESIDQTLSSINPGWHFHSLDAMGRSRGLSIGYHPRTINVIATWGGAGFIGLDLFSSKQLVHQIHQCIWPMSLKRGILVVLPSYQYHISGSGDH